MLRKHKSFSSNESSLYLVESNQNQISCFIKIKSAEKHEESTSETPTVRLSCLSVLNRRHGQMFPANAIINSAPPSV